MKRICMIFAFLAAIKAGAQTEADFQKLQRAFQPVPKARLREIYRESNQNPNELQLVLSGLFLFYKSFLSSQDQNRCNFYPSCSEYGLQAVKQLGVVRGVISTMDRLTRCNGLSPELYERDDKLLLLRDPVRW